VGTEPRTEAYRTARPIRIEKRPIYWKRIVIFPAAAACPPTMCAKWCAPSALPFDLSAFFPVFISFIPYYPKMRASAKHYYMAII
jgi:hypothetical protein